MTSYRKLDGTYTSNIEEFVQSWDEIIKPLEEAMGATVLGFDPGISFFKKDMPNAPVATLPLWAAKNLVKVLNEKS